MWIQPSPPHVTNPPYLTPRLWNDSGLFTPSLGCAGCMDKRICGGLSVATALYDCLSFCCQNPADCDTVCRKKPDEFAARVGRLGASAWRTCRAHRLWSPRTYRQVFR